MADQQAPPAGPDLSLGIALTEFTGATLLGRVGDEEVLLVRSGSEIFAVDAHCSHYHGPLAEGLVDGETVRCPWHHACFDLRTEAAAPVDRPNLSKDYLAGSAPEDWLPLRPEDFYADTAIDLRLNAEVASIDSKAKAVVLAGGATVAYDRLLLSTGAEPVRLPIPGADLPHVHVLRTLADCRAIIESAKGARRAIVIGASFIGLEAAASLRARDIEVHIVGLEARPMERVLGPEMGDFIRALHEEHGVVFHLGDTVVAIDGKRATLKSGGVLEAELVVVGVGVRPRLALAERAGLALDRG